MVEHGISGNDLGSGKEEKSYEIKKGDKFYEPSMGGLWIKNDEDDSSSLILEIEEIGDNEVTIKEYKSEEEKSYTIKFDESMDISSNTIVFDGINYSYSIKITK